VVRGLEQAGAEFNLIVLDACRDNPFSATRGGDRGLGVMGTGGRGSIVVFATSPGDVAQDGTGRNSPFTTAFLESMRTPGVEVRQLITAVQRKVQEQTGGKQVPWVNMSYTGEFYFQTVEQQLEKSQNELTGLQTDLAALEKEITARANAINNTLNTEERRRLEAEQSRAKAMEAAKQLELQRAAETQRQAEEILASQAAQDSLRNEMAARLSTQQVALARQAEERKAELERLRLQQQVAAQSLMDRLETIAQLNGVIQDIEARYRQSIDAAMADLDALQKQKEAAFRTENARDPWENATEYTKRIGDGLTRMAAEHTADKNRQRDDLLARLARDVAPVKQQLALARQELQGMRFVLDPRSVSVRVGPFDADQKKFPISVVVVDEVVPFTVNLSYSISSRDREVLRNEYYRVYSADQSGALVGNAVYRVFELEEGLWTVFPETVEVVNLLEKDAVLASAWPASTARVVDPIAYFKVTTSVTRTTPAAVPLNVVLTGLIADSTITISGSPGIDTTSSVYLASVKNPTTFRVTVDSPWMMQPVVVDRSITLASRQLIWCDLQAVAVPAGRLRIPRSDLSVEVREASTGGLVYLKAEKGGLGIKLPPGNYQVMAKLPYDRYFAFEATVMVQAGKETVLDPGKVDLTALHRYEQTTMERTVLHSALAEVDTTKLIGWAGVGAGAVGVLGSVASYLLYANAVRMYQDSSLTVDLQRYREQATLWSNLFTASLAVGIAGGATGGVMLSKVQPTIRSLSEQLKENQDQLAALEAELAAAKARKAMDSAVAGGLWK
jgi:hypothetical protein